jgi:hypothetical protein
MAPLQVWLDIGRAIMPHGAVENCNRWVELTRTTRSIRAFEQYVRGKEWGQWIVPGPLVFLRSGGVVDDTGCLVGECIEVVPESALLNGPEDARKNSGRAGAQMVQSHANGQRGDARSVNCAGAGDSQDQTPQHGSREVARGTQLEETRETGEPCVGAHISAPGSAHGPPDLGTSTERELIQESPADQGLSDERTRHAHGLTRPERLDAASRWTDAQRREAERLGLPDEAMENGKVLPALKQNDGRYVERCYEHRCDHCSVVKHRSMYYSYMWDREEHQPCICKRCEDLLKCATCEKVKGFKAFSKRQARYWDGPRRCKECVNEAELEKVVKARMRAIQGRWRAIRSRVWMVGVSALKIAQDTDYLSVVMKLRRWQHRAAEAAHDQIADEQDSDYFRPGYNRVHPVSPGPSARDLRQQVDEQEAELQEADDDQRRAGGVCRGDELVLLHGSGLDGCVPACRSDGPNDEIQLVKGHTVVAEQDWHPEDGALVLVSKNGKGVGWMQTLGENNVPGTVGGVWKVSSQYLSHSLAVGTVGTVWISPDSDSDHDDEGEEDRCAQVFYTSFSGAQGYADEAMGSIPGDRQVRVCLIARSRGSKTSKLLIEDVNEAVECDVVSDGGHPCLEFDTVLGRDGQTMCLSEHIRKSGAAGCVIQMDVDRGLTVNGNRLWKQVGPVANVRRRTVWVQGSAFHSLPLGIAEQIADVASSEGEPELDEEECVDLESDEEESLSDESLDEECESDSDDDVIAASGGHCEQ